MMRNLSPATRTFVSVAATAAGTTEVDGASVDTQGFAGVRFIAVLGTLTATQVTTLKIQGSADNATWTDLAGTHAGPAADGDGGKTLISEIFRPGLRYVRPVITRSTANAVIQCVIGELFLASLEPVTASTDNSATTVARYSVAGTA